MSFFTEEEIGALSIRRMIFHVVGKDLENPILLNEIDPPEHVDFFVERVKSAAKGNAFDFKENSNAERLLRIIVDQPDSFKDQSQALAADFQTRHSGSTSMGVFFVFELDIGNDAAVYALIKYDNEDVVRYVLEGVGDNQVPRLERFRESFVKKADAMQKIALIRLNEGGGGRLAVRDRSKPNYISDYFEGFLQVRRVNTPEQLSEKLVEVFKSTFKTHKSSLSPEIQRSGVNIIYEVLRQPGHRFDPEGYEPLLTAIFGPIAEDAPLRETFRKKLREHGVSDETFDIEPERIQIPRRRRMETAEGVQITYEDGQRPTIEEQPDGRTRIVVVTARVTKDDIDTEKGPRGH